jgi:hypothetical protein
MIPLFLSLVKSGEFAARGICSINRGGTSWDINSAFFGKIFSFESDGNTHLMNFCSALNASETEYKFEYTGANIMRFKQDGKYDVLNYLSDFDFQERENGVSYFSIGQPILIDGKYFTYDVELNIMCEQSTTGDPEVTFTISNDGNSYKIVGNTKHAVGCSAKSATPTPTPMFNPICELSAAYPDGELFNFNLKNIKSGPYGIRSKITRDGKDFNLFYKPCERMECPPENTCDDAYGFSSVYICPFNPNNGDCFSFGYAANETVVSLVNASGFNEGVHATYSSIDNWTTVIHFTTAADIFPKGYALFNGKLEYDGKVRLSAITHEADVKPKEEGGDDSKSGSISTAAIVCIVIAAVIAVFFLVIFVVALVKTCKSNAAFCPGLCTNFANIIITIFTCGKKTSTADQYNSL